MPHIEYMIRHANRWLVMSFYMIYWHFCLNDLSEAFLRKIPKVIAILIANIGVLVH